MSWGKFLNKEVGSVEDMKKNEFIVRDRAYPRPKPAAILRNCR